MVNVMKHWKAYNSRCADRLMSPNKILVDTYRRGNFVLFLLLRLHINVNARLQPMSLSNGACNQFRLFTSGSAKSLNKYLYIYLLQNKNFHDILQHRLRSALVSMQSEEVKLSAIQKHMQPRHHKSLSNLQGLLLETLNSLCCHLDHDMI